MRLRACAWLAGLLLGAVHGVIAISLGARAGGAPALVIALGLGMALGALLARWPSDHLGRRPVNLATGLLIAPAALGAALLPGPWSLAGAAVVGLGAGALLLVLPQIAHELSLRGHRRLTPQALALIPAGAAASALICRWSPDAVMTAWLLVLGLGVIHALLAASLPESPVWNAAHGRLEHSIAALKALHGPLEAAVAIDWTRLDAEMLAVQQPLTGADLRVPQVRGAVLTGFVLVLAREAPLGAAALVLGLRAVADAVGASEAPTAWALALSAGWIAVSALALLLVLRVDGLRFARIVLGVALAVLAATVLVASAPAPPGAGRGAGAALGLLGLIAAQWIGLEPACRGAIDPRVPPWLVAAQRSATALGESIARFATILVPIIVVQEFGAVTAAYALLGFEAVVLVVVLGRLPRSVTGG
ncbi:MFS transporter [Actinomyces marmotae]|uniref:MFS transporter n=1 Tax=Actinomyces marmotae TaxID=2737173 RepID=UPI0022A7DB84|nr:MFS transporter [Actinomyces marmotae]